MFTPAGDQLEVVVVGGGELYPGRAASSSRGSPRLLIPVELGKGQAALRQMGQGIRNVNGAAVKDGEGVGALEGAAGEGIQQDLFPGEDHQLDVPAQAQLQGSPPGLLRQVPPPQVAAGAGVAQGGAPRQTARLSHPASLEKCAASAPERPVDSTTLTPAARAVRTASREAGEISPPGQERCRPGPGRSDRFSA